MGVGGEQPTEPRPTPNAVAGLLERLRSGSRTLGDKLQSREGNSPDRQLRSSSPGLVGNAVGPLRQPGGWLRSSHPLNSA